MANDALEQSLRAEIDKHFNARLNELRDEMSRVQELLNETVSRHKTETDSIISNMMDKISSEDDTMNAVIAEHLRNAEEVAAQAAAERAAAEAAAKAAERAAEERAAAQAEAEQRAAQAEAERAAAQSEAERLAAQAEAEKAAAQAAIEQANAQTAAEAAARAAAEEAAMRAAQERAAAEEAASRAAEEKAAAEEAAARAAEEKAAAERSAAEKIRQKISENIGLLRNAIVDLGKQKSQAEILKTLVGYASSLAPRVAFFVVKEGHTKGWRAFGFENTVGNDSINQIVIPLTDETLLGESVNAQATWDGTPGQFRDDHKLMSNLGSVTPNRIVAVPLIARSRSVAILYADSADEDAGSINVDALESLVRVAAMNVEMLAASRAAVAHSAVAAQPQPAPQPVVAQPVQPAPEPAPQIEAVEATPAPAEEAATTGPLTPPEVIPVVPVEPAVSAEAETIPVSVAEPVEERVEMKTETASFDLSGYEPIKPVESAPTPPIQTYAPVETPVERQTFSIPSQPPANNVTPLTTDSRFRRRDIDLPIEVSEEERRYHNEARRFARLLVSEIKLYNEPKVKEGRETRDLYDRLREAIDRSREMYDKRVSPQVASKFDYFHYELVNTLAEGDENKLGNDYPGASV